jgi:hypothetical protein
MITVLRAAGLRVAIYPNDHEPAHVHVIGDGDAKIDLTGPDGPRFVWINRMSRGEAKRAFALVRDNRALLLTRWREIHERPD